MGWRNAKTFCVTYLFVLGAIALVDIIAGTGTTDMDRMIAFVVAATSTILSAIRTNQQGE